MNTVRIIRYHQDLGVTELITKGCSTRLGCRKTLSASKGEHMSRRFGTCPMRTGRIMRKISTMESYQHDGKSFLWK